MLEWFLGAPASRAGLPAKPPRRAVVWAALRSAHRSSWLACGILGLSAGIPVAPVPRPAYGLKPLLRESRLRRQSSCCRRRGRGGALSKDSARASARAASLGVFSNASELFQTFLASGVDMWGKWRKFVYLGRQQCRRRRQTKGPWPSPL